MGRVEAPKSESERAELMKMPRQRSSGLNWWRVQLWMGPMVREARVVRVIWRVRRLWWRSVRGSRAIVKRAVPVVIMLWMPRWSARVPERIRRRP